jgi:glycosyltransferase involved in cell wall biosynthesis
LPDNSLRKKILIITEYFPPEIGAGSNRAYELAKHWSSFGAEVTVLTGFPDYPDGKRPEKYIGLNFMREKLDGFEIIRTFTYSAPNIGFVKRIFSYLSFLFSSIIKGSKAVGSQDIIIATSPPFFVGVSGFCISRLKKIPFIFEVRDLWPESIVQLGQIKNKFIIYILEKIENLLYRKAIHIVPVADSYKNYIISKNISPEKITVVKNGINTKEIEPRPFNEELAEKLKIEGKFIISYIGTLGLSHALDSVLDCANLLKNEEQFCFLLVGSGAEKRNLILKKEKLRLNNVIFLEPVERSQLAEYYSISDILLVSLRKIDLFKKVIPSKIFEIMSYKKPILISVDGEAREIIEKADSGIFVNPEDPQDLCEKITRLSNDPKLMERLALNGRNFVEINYDRRKLSQDYFKLIMNILK